MLNWITENHQTLSLLANIGMLIVWIAYLHLFLVNFRRQKRSKILITIGAGRSLDAQCILTNMSAEPVYMESLIATLETSEEQWVCPVTDVQELARDKQPSDPRELTRQGPFMPGAVMDVGSFRHLIARVVRDAGRPADSEEDLPENLTSFEIQAIADFGPDDLLVGAKRRFDLVKRDGRWFLKPQSPYTIQIRSRRERHRIKRMLEDFDA